MTLNVIRSWNYYFIFAFNINKVTKIITPGDPQRKEFHSQKPLIPHIPHSRGMKFGEKLKNPSRNVLLVDVHAIFFF